MIPYRNNRPIFLGLIKDDNRKLIFYNLTAKKTVKEVEAGEVFLDHELNGSITTVTYMRYKDQESQKS